MFDRLFSRVIHPPIKTQRVCLGKESISIPIVRLHGNHPGKTLVVTGGMDGDEYAGIEAAFSLIDLYRSQSFTGSLIVIPVLNVPGFFAEQSFNPQDKLFPKSIFPGSASGTSSQQLIHWLVQNVLSGADAWLDLHSGAITEQLTPFLWTFKTNVKQIDALTDSLITQSGAAICVHEKTSFRSKAKTLAKKGCWYVMAEAGERGNTEEYAISQHMHWAQTMMRTLGMIEQEQTLPTASSPVVCQHVYQIQTKTQGIWRPSIQTKSKKQLIRIKQNQMLGTLSSLDGLKHHPILSPVEGVVLWHKATLCARPGDTLLGIGIQDENQ